LLLRLLSWSIDVYFKGIAALPVEIEGQPVVTLEPCRLIRQPWSLALDINSTLLHLLPTPQGLRIWLQDSCDFGIGSHAL
jgi:hypothetical protein